MSMICIYSEGSGGDDDDGKSYAKGEKEISNPKTALSCPP